ncbi:hypothetical protein [Streptomyces sp. NPDC056821]|uniref:hypothetical protein n=1 Tax=unclassified Streptomyces TaxID=2593676 RepID=UPI003685CED7
MIKDSERRLARHQTALDAGADPAVVTQWINDAHRDKQTEQKKLDTLPAFTQKTPLTAKQLRGITESLRKIAQRIHAVGAGKNGPIHEALGIDITYEHATRTPAIRPRSHAMVSEG